MSEMADRKTGCGTVPKTSILYRTMFSALELGAVSDIKDELVHLELFLNSHPQMLAEIPMIAG
jgi:hypothetical protein